MELCLSKTGTEVSEDCIPMVLVKWVDSRQPASNCPKHTHNIQAPEAQVGHSLSLLSHGVK